MGGGSGGGWSFPSESPDPSGNTKKSPVVETDKQATGGGHPQDDASGGGGGAPPSDPCNIQDTGTLRSPVQSVISTLNQGDWLDLVEEIVNGVPVLVAKHNSATAGVIDCAREQDILDCISNGHIYQARIERIHGGAVTVTVRRVGP